jgi:tetratricopeptide (TPR) repeat protein
LAGRLYGEIVEADSTQSRALHRLALITAWNEEYDEALTLFQRLLSLEPENVEARVDRARVLAWRGDVRQALEVLDGILENRPELPQALEAKAQFQSSTGEYSEALSSYEDLLGIADDPTGVLLAQARVLGWASRLEESRTVYDSILASNPQNLEARLGLARVMAYSDRTHEAVSRYRSVLQDHPDNREARRGLARVLTWSGKLPEGEEAWRESLDAAPDDLASVVGLAQNLRWQGRNAAALQVLEEAGDAREGNPDLMEQLRWVEAALSPRFDFSVIDEADSDDNRMTTTRVQGRWNPARRFAVRAEAYVRELEQTGIDLSRRAWGVALEGSLQVEPGWTLEGGLGETRTNGTGAGSFTSFQLGVTTPGRYSLGAGLSYKRRPLDVTARLAEQGVEMGVLDATGRWTPAAGWQVSASGGIGTFAGVQDNRRVHLGGSVSRSLNRQWTLGLSHRYFGFDKDLNEFYFDPDYFGLTELVGRWSWRPGPWSLQLEAAPGAQKIRSDGEVAAAFRASARIAYRVAPGREISLSGGYSSAGVQSFSTGDSDYRYRAVILGGSWVF